MKTNPKEKPKLKPTQTGEWFREWCPSNLYRTGNLVPVEAFEQILRRPDPGFASVYMFKSEDAKQVRANGSSRGLGSLIVAADAVTLDIDNPNDINQVLEKLDSLKLGYEVWDSGRGYHIVIPHDFIEDNRLPYSHRCWVESLGLSVDLTLYQHARVLRLPGTVNVKTGRRKQFVEKVDGMKPVIELRDPPQFNLKPDTFGLKTIESVLNQFQRLASSEPVPGNRHTRIWSAARSAAEAGISYSTALELLQEINNAWQTPKEPSEVEKAVTQAYKQTEKYAPE